MSVDEFKEVPASIENMQVRSASLRALSEDLNNNELLTEQDISGQDVNTQGRLEAALQELETDSEESDEEDEPEQEKHRDDEYDTALGLAPTLVLGGIILVGAAYFLNQPFQMEHPHNMRNYF